MLIQSPISLLLIIKWVLGVRQPECDITHLSPVLEIRAYGTLHPLLNAFMAQRQLFSVTDSIEYNFWVTEAVHLKGSTVFGKCRVLILFGTSSILSFSWFSSVPQTINGNTQKVYVSLTTYCSVLGWLVNNEKDWEGSSHDLAWVIIHAVICP